MMTNPPNPDQLTVDDLRAYQAGQLTGAARHRVERLLLEQPFYADALAGLDALQKSGASLPAQTAQLRSALHQRIRESATKQHLWPLWLTTAIAAIMLVLYITIYLIFFRKPARPNRPQPSTKQSGQSAVPFGKSNSSARFVPAETVVDGGGVSDSLPGDVYKPGTESMPMRQRMYDPSAEHPGGPLSDEVVNNG